MNIFKPIVLQWWQVGIFKLCLTTFGIILGTHYFIFFYAHLSIVAALFVVSALYGLFVWVKQQSRHS